MKDGEKLRLSRRAWLRTLAAAGASALAAACSGKKSPTPIVKGRTPTATAETVGARPTVASPAAATKTAALNGSRTNLPLLSQSRPAGAALPASPQAPSPSPSPTVTPAAQTATPTAPAQAAQAQASPTATGPTATRRPTSTPRPTATPFPPGPPTKLGLFVGRNDPRIRDLLRTGNITMVKTLEYDASFAEEVKRIAPNTLLIGRIDLPQINLDQMNDPKGAARAFVDQLLPIAAEPRRLAYFDGWEAFNEPVVANAEQMGRLAAFEAERTRLLAEQGVRSVIGNFASGTPDLAVWPHFRPALEAVLANRGYLGLHEYAAPTMQEGSNRAPADYGVAASDEGWLTLRYRKLYRGYLQPNKLVAPLLFTEVGVDGGVGNRPGPNGTGWLDFANYWVENGMGFDPPGIYMQQLAWYDAHLQQDSYVLGAAIFVASATPGWASFEILNDVEPILRQYVSVHPRR